MTKTAAKHEVDGTYRPENHDPRAVISPPGSPIRPKKLTAPQRRMWNTIVDMIPEDQLGTVDTYLLEELVRTYSMMVEAREVFQADIAEREPRLAYQALAKNVYQLADLFGLSPKSRQKMEVTPAATKASAKAKPADVMGELISRLGGSSN